MAVLQFYLIVYVFAVYFSNLLYVYLLYIYDVRFIIKRLKILTLTVAIICSCKV